MKLAVVMAMALATLSASDFASARQPRKGSIAKGSLAAPKKAVRLKAGRRASTVSEPKTKGIIMRDGGICNPRWGC